jgi:hypothetical protein
MAIRSFLASGKCLAYLQVPQELHLSVREVRMPNVDNEGDPSLCPIVPRLVLERIIKRHRLACHNVTRVVGDAQARTICPHQRQMQPQLFVGRTMAVDSQIRSTSPCSDNHTRAGQPHQRVRKCVVELHRHERRTGQHIVLTVS